MMVGNFVHGASMRLARAQGTSFPRRRESKGASVARSACRVDGATNFGSRLCGNDGGMPTASLRLARAQGTSFPRRREPKGASVVRGACRVDGATNFGFRLRGNDGGMPTASLRLARAHDGSGSNA